MKYAMKRTSLVIPKIVYDALAILAVKKETTIYRLIWQAIFETYKEELRPYTTPEWLQAKITGEDENEHD